jgi:4-hydroxy-tetrahydrodipicolinate synthase
MFSAARFSGVYTALVTPFSEDGSAIDFEALDALIEAQIAAGIAGLVPCGTTGEAPTLSDAEQRQVIERTVRVTRGRIPVVAGTGSFSTEKTIRASRTAFEVGADAVMVVMPYYSRPTQAGLVEHVTRLAASIKESIVLYNIPIRTGVDLSAEATEAICERSPNVVGIKDATGNVVRCQELVRRLGDRLAVMSGDDALTLPMMACGARGVVSTTSNLFPEPIARVAKLGLSGDFSEARRIHLALLPVYEAMFIETSPAPVKFALSRQGRITCAVRPPLVAASETARAKITEAVRRYQGDA